MTTKSKQTQPKQPTLASIQRRHRKQFNVRKRINLSTGEYTEIYQRFRKSSIQKLMVEYTAYLNQLNDQKVEWEKSETLVFIYYMLLLRHFTTLGDVIPTEIGPLTVVGQQLLDLGILEEILNEFPQEELTKLNKAIEEVGRNLNGLIETSALNSSEGDRAENEN